VSMSEEKLSVLLLLLLFIALGSQFPRDLNIRESKNNI
jgi:hypothetical protein